MRDRRRTWFAAPLVAVTACSPSSSSSSPPPPPPKPVDEISSLDRIYPQGTACVFSETFDCPKNASCNPPPPRAIECPAEMGAAAEARIAPAKPGTIDDNCILIVPPCAARSCGVPIKCVGTSWANTALPLAWTITPGADGRCIATSRPRTNFDGGLAIAIDCPTGVVDAGVIERANAKAPCVVCGKSPCGMSAPAIACPDVKP